VLAALVFNAGDDAASPQTSPVAPPPGTTPSETTPTFTTTITTEPPSTTTTTSTPTTTGSAPPGITGADAQGFVGHTARCDAGSTPAAMLRTAQSLAVVCETTPGSFYYRGERLSDGANLELANAVRSGGGFVAINPDDGARYEVRPDRLLITSNGRVNNDESVQEYAAR
jgi:serine/threonine protein kinase, bacterial